MPSTGASQHGAATSTTDFLALTANRAVLLLGNGHFHQAHFRASPHAMPENDADTEADHRHCPPSTMGHTVISMRRDRRGKLADVTGYPLAPLLS